MKFIILSLLGIFLTLLGISCFSCDFSNDSESFISYDDF